MSPIVAAVAVLLFVLPGALLVRWNRRVPAEIRDRRRLQRKVNRAIRAAYDL